MNQYLSQTMVTSLVYWQRMPPSFRGGNVAPKYRSSPLPPHPQFPAISSVPACRRCAGEDRGRRRHGGGGAGQAHLDAQAAQGALGRPQVQGPHQGLPPCQEGRQVTAASQAGPGVIMPAFARGAFRAAGLTTPLPVLMTSAAHCFG